MSLGDCYVFRLSSTYSSTFPTKIKNLFDCARPLFWIFSPMFRSSWPKSSLFWRSRPKSRKFRPCSQLKMASRPRNFSRKTTLARLSKSKHKSSASTREGQRHYSLAQADSPGNPQISRSKPVSCQFFFN